MNEIKLQEGHPVDENLRPIKVGGKSTALETAQHGNGARVNGDLEVTGDTYASIDKMYSGLVPAYSGMILGYTVIGLDATPAKHDVLASMTVVDDDLKVSFVFPPSGNVEIFASIYIQSDSPRPVTFGLSTTNATTGFTSLGAKYENNTYSPTTGIDSEQHSHIWYITGTAGSSEELWFAAGATQAARVDLYWGGDSSSVADASHPMEYQPFVMKATALPSTIYTG